VKKEPVQRDRTQRAVAIGGVALLAVFVALAAWSLQGDPDPDPTTAHPSKPAVSRPADPPPAEPLSPDPEPPTKPPVKPPEPEQVFKLLKTPKEMSKLLAQRFQFTRHDGDPAFAHLRSALGPERTVTVLNVW